jgi:hypothetical protein
MNRFKRIGLTWSVLLLGLLAARAAYSQIVITEIMHSPGGDDALWEWVEILNTTDAPVDLDGWVFDDDDDPNLAAANIDDAGGSRNTIVPAGAVAVLYPGDELDFMPERFTDAWGAGITLIGVNGLTVLTPTDAIGLWQSHDDYMDDAIPMATMSPRRTFTSAAASINYATGFPSADPGHSIAWNGTGGTTIGSNWVASQASALGAHVSNETMIDGAPINSTNDRGNPGLLPAGPAASGLLITEIMFAPQSPVATVGYTEPDFEWIEIYNNTTSAIDFEDDPHVFDDIAGNNIATANVNSGTLAAGDVGILFNAERITVEDMQAMWGTDNNYIPVDNWPALNNSGGDTIAIWNSLSDYNNEPVVDSGRTHQNAIAAVTYNTVAGQGWPTVNDESSIWLDTMNGDPNAAANWTRAGAAGDALSFQSSPIFDSLIDHEGGDVGSPGYAPGVVINETPGDYNDNGRVDAADYAIWRKLVGTTSVLPNDPHVGTMIDDDQYNTWRLNFGRSAAGQGSFDPVAIPEPQALLMIAAAVFCLSAQRPRLRWPLTALSAQR